jgi:uncharacterized protein (DUF302 family)
MNRRKLGWSAAGLLLVAGIGGCADAGNGRPPTATASANGIVAGKSAYDMAGTVARLKQDIAAKGLKFFDEIDEAKLAQEAGIAALPSTLLVFGNPALGTQFITSNPQSGIDWPVRLLVYEDSSGQVWTEYTDFRYIQARHRIADRDAQFQKASEVIASIASSVAER